MTTPTRSSRARPVPSAPDAPTSPSPLSPPPADGSAAAARRPRSAPQRILHDPDGGTGEVHELLVAAVDEAARLLDADGAMVYLVDPATGHLRFAHDAGIRSKRSRAWVRSIDLPVGVGMFGRAVAERAVVLTSDYMEDPAFAHAADTDRVVRDIGIRSMVVAPLVTGETVFGAMGTFSSRRDAFSPSAIALVRALADHAAAAMANARLIEALDASSRELAERADVERSLREIAARISAATDLPAVLQLGVDEAARLLHADGARIDLIDPDVGLLRWAFASGAVKPDDEVWPDDPDETLDQGISGQAVVTGRAFWSGDYIADTRFPHGPGADQYITTTGLRSVMSAPLIVESGPIGALTVFSTRPDAWSEADGSLLEAIAAQAAITIRTTRLFDELDQSRAALGRRAEAEQALREIASRVSATHDQEEILQAVIDAAVRLLGATGAMIDLVGDAGMAEAWTSREAGMRASSNMDLLSEVSLEADAGVSGRAIHSRQVEWTGDYLGDDRFAHTRARDAFVRESGIRSVIAAPLVHRDVVVGAITVYGDRGDAFDAADAVLLGALADQAAISIANARLVEQLERSQATVARRAETERALRDITARIAALREPEVILDRVVDEARRLLDTDGAHLTRMDDEGAYLVPVVVAGATDAKTQAWLLDMKFPLGGGINGLAAQLGEPVWTNDYTADPRIPHEGNDDEVAARLGLSGMAAAPLRAPGGEVIGTLAISSATPRTFDAEELDLLQGLADQAAIAITNSTLLERLTESEERYRFLVENSPDVVFSTDAEGRFTFMSESMERMTGWKPDEVIGEHFSKTVEAASLPETATRWAALMDDPATEQIAHVNLQGPDGRLVPVEVSAVAMVDAEGRFSGIHGSTRDIGERARLERELRRQAGELAAGEERAHLARELHDSVTQALFSMTLVSRSVEMLLDRDPDKARAQLVQLRDLQREALAEMRALIFELRPGNLEHDGLTRALRTHTAALQGRIGLPVVVESTLDERLPLPIEEVLYRVSQEALHNVVKHAGARQVRLELGRIASGVRLRISDDGKGFDPDRVPDGHLGLAGMRARADKIDARFLVKSVTGEGTTIEVVVPNAALAAAGAAPPAADPASIRDG